MSSRHTPAVALACAAICAGFGCKQTADRSAGDLRVAPAPAPASGTGSSPMRLVTSEPAGEDAESVHQPAGPTMHGPRRAAGAGVHAFRSEEGALSVHEGRSKAAAKKGKGVKLAFAAHAGRVEAPKHEKNGSAPLQ